MQTETYPAPSQGWVQNGNIVTASPDQAERLDNWIPTTQGARLRGGAQEYADLAAACVRLFSYQSGSTVDLFGSTATGILDADRVNGTGAAATYEDVEGLSSGDWAAVHQTSSAGQFMVVVNGTDYMHYWDGADWNPITTVAVNDLSFDAETVGFTVGETVSGGTSGASATVLSIQKSSATAGTLRLGTITSGPFQNDEALTGSSTGAATADGASSAGSTITLSGVASTALSQAWLWKERLFFIEENTTSAWYLGVNAIGGTAVELDLGSLMNLGGNLLFGATWSLDSGSGLDDVCIFVTDQGEVLVYEGTDPASANTWSLVGVYSIGKPLNKHAWYAAGGDLAVLTEDGIVPISEALRKDRAALQSNAVTYRIEDAWKEAVKNRTTSYPISATLWQSGTLLLVGTPEKYEGQNVAFVANARNGAWARITGWDVRCSTVSSDILFFGDNTGKVYKADTGGQDGSSQFTGTYVPKFSYAPQWRSGNAVRITYRAQEELDITLGIHSDYQIDALTPPASSSVYTGDVWGTGVWGTFIWGSSLQLETFTEWQSTYDNGYALAPSVQVTSNSTAKLTCEILSTQLIYETGNPL